MKSHAGLAVFYSGILSVDESPGPWMRRGKFKAGYTEVY